MRECVRALGRIDVRRRDERPPPLRRRRPCLTRSEGAATSGRRSSRRCRSTHERSQRVKRVVRNRPFPNQRPQRVDDIVGKSADGRVDLCEERSAMRAQVIDDLFFQWSTGFSR